MIELRIGARQAKDFSIILPYSLSAYCPKAKPYGHSRFWRFWQSLQKLIQLRINYITMHKAIIIQNPKLKVA